MRTLRAVVSVASFLIVIAGSPLRADEALNCSKLLTQAELEAAVGEAIVEISDPVVYAEGHTQCAFFTAQATKRVMFTFLNLEAIQEGMIPTESVPEYFDMNVRSAEDIGQKGERVKGVGVRAVLFTEPEAMSIYVETKKGFAEIRTTGVTAKELEAVAKAVVP